MISFADDAETNKRATGERILNGRKKDDENVGSGFQLLPPASRLDIG
jgi:hypothetical protein